MESEQYTLDDQQNIERTRKKILKFLESNENNLNRIYGIWPRLSVRGKYIIQTNNLTMHLGIPEEQ